MTTKYLYRMKLYFLAAAFYLTLANPNIAHSADFDYQVSAGAGRQYSGLFGAQLSMGTQRARILVGAGLLTFSTGLDLKLTRNVSTGVYGYVGYASPLGVGGHLSYHFNGVFSKGFALGINVTQITESDRTKPNAPDKNDVMLAIGYHF